MLTGYFEIEHTLTCLGWACTTLICIFFFRRRIYRSAPEFTNFIVYNTAIAWALDTYLFTSQIYHPRSLGYYYWFWAAEFVGEAIEVLAIYAIFARVLQVVPESRERRRLIPLLSVVLLLMLASVNFVQSGWPGWTITKRLEFIRENLVLAECGFVLAAILFSLVVAAPWEAPIKGILGGFAVDSSVRLTIYAIGIYHSRPALFWPLGRMLMDVAESLGWYVWLMVILRTPKNNSPDKIAYQRDLESYRLDLEGWTSGFGGMVYRLHSNIRAIMHSYFASLRHR
jgi:hypothetical protein